MDVSLIEKRLLSHPGATKALHESWGWMVYWVGGKQFACEFVVAPDAKPPYAGRHLLSLKCDTDRIRELRAEFPDAVLPAITRMVARGSRSILGASARLAVLRRSSPSTCAT